jgi:hypothetical protein
MAVWDFNDHGLRGPSSNGEPLQASGPFIYAQNNNKRTTTIYIPQHSERERVTRQNSMAFFVPFPSIFPV